MRRSIGSSLLWVAVGLASCGGDEQGEPAARTAADPAPLPTAPPPKPSVPGHDAATISAAGPYRFENAVIKITLFLEENGRFRMITQSKTRDAQRTGEGTWTLKGETLTMVYDPMPGVGLDKPQTETNRFSRGRVMLKAPDGSEYVLDKQKLLRIR